MSRLTLGPLSVERDRAISYEREGRVLAIAEIYSGPCESIEQADAYARLFAAAPDLLVAAKQCLQSWDTWQDSVKQIIHRPVDETWMELETLRAAIAKAEGNQ